PYTLWVATLYQDELRAKADQEDGWAKGVLNSPPWPLLLAQERLALRRAGRILALSPHTAERIQTLLPEAADRIETVLYPIDLEAFKPDDVARQQSPYGRYLFLAARINDPRKNVGMLLDAFRLIHEQQPDLKLVMSGELPNHSLGRQASDLGLDDVIVFLGPVEKDELIRLYQGAELFVLPSLQEGLGIVVLEALACGTPVVATRCGGPEGIVIEGQTGILVDDRHDPAAFAQAVLDLLTQPDQLEALRISSAAHARQHFAEAVIAAQIKRAYQHIGHHPPHPLPIFRAAAVAWAVIIFGFYMFQQLRLRWPAIQSQLIDPIWGG
ncbi:MAG: glycosyltransferase family 4 protein, partial [Chloroflexi bacterium]|nr:glycosyltransferase family 4 protein [Chloroflexota bacterium]